jgi:hypothetical protein
MMVVRINRGTRAGIERVANARGESMSLQIDRAAQRWVIHNEHLRLGQLSDRIIMLALSTERSAGKTISNDPETADRFAVGVSELLKQRTAVTQQPSEESRAAAWLSLNVVNALADAGVDWSDAAFTQATTQRGSW